mmetsp:Transcript_18649/g.29851  ORF Transcript_18649/g.29851 Transcript_18649/m.29851 type:complete len:346 (-) Transcript_18649:25-1062(-)
MDGRGVQGVVHLKLEEESGGAIVDEAADAANQDGRPGIDHRAGTRDGDEAGEDAVQGGGDIGRVLERDVDGEGGGAAGTGGEGGGDRCAGSVLHVLEREGGDRVEAIPAEPQDESAEGGENGGVPGHRLDLAGAGGEATRTGAKDDGTHQGCGAASHVYDARTGEIDQPSAAHPHVRLLVACGPRGHEAIGAPAPVHDGGVDEAGQDEGVGEVSGERASLGNGARDDGGGGGGEGPLKHPHGIVSVVRFPLNPVHEEGLHGVVFAVAAHVAESDRVSDGPPDQASEASVEDVLQENVLRVLCTDGTSLQEREASLHEEHEVGAEQKPEDVEVRLHCGGKGCVGRR